MNLDQFQHLLNDMSLFDYTVISVNLLLIVFAQPILKRFSSQSLSQKTFDLRFNLLRAINVFILVAYGYQIIYEPNAETSITIKAITILAILYLSYVSNYILQFLVNKHYGKAREINQQTIYIQTYQSRLFSIITAILISIIALISIIRILGFESLLEAGGVLGVFGVLLALTQASWAPDIISGLIILNSDMFEEGDIVEFNGLIGRVYRTKLFHTEIINVRNNHRIMLRNANIRDRTIHNLSKFASGMGLRECLQFNIGYDVPTEKIKTMLCKAFDNAIEAGVCIEPNPEPQVKVLETGDHAVTWGILFHIKKVDQIVNTRRDLREHILQQSTLDNISLATPLTHEVALEKSPVSSEHYE